MFNSADKNHDGKLTRDEWTQVLNSSDAPTSMFVDTYLFGYQFCWNFREEVEKFFNSMDRDFDGRLSFEEFMGEESEVEKLFKFMDLDSDGDITKQVGMEIINLVPCINAKSINYSLQIQEFKAVCSNFTEEQVEIVFNKFDSSGEDKLDYREFCEMVIKLGEGK